MLNKIGFWILFNINITGGSDLDGGNDDQFKWLFIYTIIYLIYIIYNNSIMNLAVVNIIFWWKRMKISIWVYDIKNK